SRRDQNTSAAPPPEPPAPSPLPPPAPHPIVRSPLSRTAGEGSGVRVPLNERIQPPKTRQNCANLTTRRPLPSTAPTSAPPASPGPIAADDESTPSPPIHDQPWHKSPTF